MSDALASFDPKALEPIVTSLMKRLPALSRGDGDLHALLKRIVAGQSPIPAPIAADGSLFTVPADVLWAIALTRSNGKVGRQIRLNLQLDVLHFMPTGFDLSGAGDGSETAAFARNLVADVIYLVAGQSPIPAPFDRGFVDFSFLHAVLDKGSDFVVRLKSDTKFVALEERPLTEQDRADGILSDRIGRVPGSAGCPGFAASTRTRPGQSPPPGQTGRKNASLSHPGPLAPRAWPPPPHAPTGSAPRRPTCPKTLRHASSLRPDAQTS